MSDDLKTKLDAVDTAGASRFGDDWGPLREAFKRGFPQGIPPAELNPLANNADAPGIIQTVGRQVLIQEASDGNRESEAAYQRIRSAERKRHAELKGRVWRQATAPAAIQA